MSDLPIPDDLVAIARRIHMTQFDDADLCDCADDELLDADTLAALAEWADGSLIDPDGWRRLDAEEVALIEVVEWTDDGLPVDFGIDLTNPGECYDGDALHTLTDRTEA